MAAAITEATFNNVGEVTVYLSGTVAATGDWVVLDSAFPGTLDLVGRSFAKDGDTDVLVWTYPTLAVKAGVDSTTTQSVTYEGATADMRTSGGYYVYNDSTLEVMYVEVDSGYDSTTGTLTVQRGALGSTAVAIGENDVLQVLNCIEITANAGGFWAKFTPLPTDPKVGILG